MSLKFLAVGQSLVGIRRDKSPYAVNKESQLPSFDGTPRFKAERAMVQTDWLQKTEPVEARPLTPVMEGMPAPAAVLASPQPAPASKKAKRSWFSFLKFRWFQTSKPRHEFVQSEMSLEKIQVMRNDLADADLRLVLKRKKKTKPVFSASQSNNGIVREGWSELTAKLFELGQK